MSQYPLFLPPGSVRAILALILVVAFVIGQVVPLALVMAVLGFYFQARQGAGPAGPPGPPGPVTTVVVPPPTVPPLPWTPSNGINT